MYAVLDIKKSGLWKPAMRAGVIEKLLKSGYADCKEKKLLPTDRGVGLILIMLEKV